MKLTQAQQDEAIDMAVQGYLIIAVTTRLGISLSQFVRYRNAEPAFARLFTEAQRDGADALAEKLMKRAGQKNGDVQRDRLAVETGFKYLSKKHPTVWGDSVNLNVTGGLSLLPEIEKALLRDSATPALLGSDATSRIIDLKRIGDSFAPDATSEASPNALEGDDPEGVYR